MSAVPVDHVWGFSGGQGVHDVAPASTTARQEEALKDTASPRGSVSFGDVALGHRRKSLRLSCLDEYVPLGQALHSSMPGVE
jgi:hypothetical protein